jgi:hypothetical protein
VIDVDSQFYHISKSRKAAMTALSGSMSEMSHTR